MTTQHYYQEIPEHVRRIIDRDGETEFTPPSFERWLGRLQMVRTLAAMAAFLLVGLFSYAFGQTWEGSVVRGLAASIVFFFFAWASGLFIFGELYDAEVTAARSELEQKERERARRIEEYYRARLRQQAAETGQEFPDDMLPGGIPSMAPTQAMPTAPAAGAPSYEQPTQHLRAA